MRLTARLALGVLAAALAVGLWSPPPAYAAVGDHVSGADFALTTGNDAEVGITKGPTYLHVLDHTDHEVYAYTTGGVYTNTGNFSPSVIGSSYRYTGITHDGDYFYLVIDYTAGTSVASVVRTYTAAGSNISAHNFDLAAANDAPTGITWDGAYLRVVDSGANKVFTYTNTGTYTSAQDFALASTGNPDTTNGDAAGITWDGSHFWVVDSGDDAVYAYDSSGNTVSSNNFDLVNSGLNTNTNPTGIAWDGTYLRVVDGTDRKVYTYEGAAGSGAPTENFGLADNVEYAASVSSEVVAYGDWKCIRKTTAETVTINNTSLDIHGFCAQPSGSDGVEVEIHLSVDTTYAELVQFANVTGNWWFIEEGSPATFDQRIYDDNFATTTDTGTQVAFTEEDEDYLASDRLQFDTMAKSVTDTDCAETNGVGFACSQSFLSSLSAGDDAVLLFSLVRENRYEFADAPGTPDSVSVTRNDAYTVATVSWDLFDAVTVYQVERLTAVQVDVGTSSRIEYGDPVVYDIDGTQEGVSSYEDSTVEAHRTYQYRVRARGAGVTAWSEWSEYVFSGAVPQTDLQPPTNVQLIREGASVNVSWTAPVGDLDGYTVQRQELVVVQGSTLFANIITLSPAGETWFGATTASTTDDTIVATQTYEYRVAAVADDLVGAYSDWFRVAPTDTSLGDAPANIRYESEGSTIYDGRREFWLKWDGVDGAEDYEVQVRVFDVATGDRTDYDYVVTDPTYFHTSYGRVHVRVRARKLDAVQCAAADDDRCLTDWTGWYQVRFSPKVEIAAPATTSPSTSTEEFREAAVEATEAILELFGTTPDGALVLNFATVTFGLVLGSLALAMTYNRGMAALGAGMGVSSLILVWYAGYLLLGTPVAWAIGAQVANATAGMYAFARKFGVFR